MATVQKISYYAMDIPNRAGEAARILTALAKEGVDLLAFTGFPSGRKAQVDFVPAKPAAFLAAARRAGLRMRGGKTAFLIRGSDRPGAVAKILSKLAAAGINVTAIDAASAGGGRFGAILWVKRKDVARAARALGV
jgi:hypothetical protein